jgi:Ni/Co efflux regulator RcnB
MDVRKPLMVDRVLRTRSQAVAEELASVLGKPVAGATPRESPVDELGRSLEEFAPRLPRKSSHTVLPIGHQWTGKDVRPNGRAQERRVSQMQARGLRHCDIGEHWVAIAQTRMLGEKVSCFDCIPETVADVEAHAQVAE